MKKRTRNFLFILAFLLFFGIFAYSGIRLWNYYSAAEEAGSAYDALQQLHQVSPTEATDAVDLTPFETMTQKELEEAVETPYTGVEAPESGEIVYLLPEFEDLYTLNPDLVGWLTIPGTVVDYPVVHRPRDTDYYLYRDFQGKYSSWGCLYVREACDVFAPSDNVVIYGHRMYDGSMFGQLGNYESYSYWQEHKYFRFDTLRGRHEYEVVCVMRISASQGAYPYHTFTNAVDELDFYAFWSKCQEKAIYDTGADVRYGDKLLSLFTCEYSQTNGRLVIIGRRIT